MILFISSVFELVFLLLEVKIFILDFESLDECGFVLVSNVWKLINEEYCEIKCKLFKNVFGVLFKILNNSNIIMVSSVRLFEGKMFIVINFVLSIVFE